MSIFKRNFFLFATAIIWVGTSELVCSSNPGNAVHLSVDLTGSTRKASPMLYGLMTEEINHSYDGGLYAELIQNRIFKDNPDFPAHWSVVNGADSKATIALDSSQPINNVLTTCLRLDAENIAENSFAGIANDGFWGIPVKPNTSYKASFYALSEKEAGPLTVSIESPDGKTVYASATIPAVSTKWKLYTVTLKTGNTPVTDKARFVITTRKSGIFRFNLLSLFPPTWNNRENGFRKDIMQMLVDLKPAFLRFPGGNYLEGNTFETHFDWKKTIGPLDMRAGHEGCWGYRSSDGMGLYEFLTWCEDMKAEPVLAVFAGYTLNGSFVKTSQELRPFIEDALDEIEYVTGDSTTKWGSKRAEAGHPAPFRLHYIEIGNEDNFDKSGSYPERFNQFRQAIKARFPDLVCISTADTSQFVHQNIPVPEMVDEHYYRSAADFQKMGHSFYEKYNRNGFKVFVGEWAAFEDIEPWKPGSGSLPRTPNMKAALGDAAWMTEMESNSDVVRMQCYAPLLANVNSGASQWRPDLIGYDGVSAYGSPSYYAFKMFSRNYGDIILNRKIIPEKNGTVSGIYCSATKDSSTKTLYIKIVNTQSTSQKIRLSLSGTKKLLSKGTITTLAAQPDETNSVASPLRVVPESKELTGIQPEFLHEFPPYSITVLKISGK